jgi:hypothetical protein
MFTIKIREKANTTAKPLRLLSIISVAALGEIFFELNNTDGDLGIHGLIDGGSWKQVWIKDPARRTLLNVVAKTRLRNQAMTELSFESAEPPFDELDPENFFRRFKEGEYTIYGRSQDDIIFSTTTEVTHVMPAPADGIMLNDDPINLDEVDCEDEGTIPEVEGDTVTISWDPVTESHPEIGEEGDVEIVNYEIAIEVEVGEEGDEFTSVFDVILPPGVTSMTIPEEFLELSDEFKYEILAREESFNQTAVESCFVLAE